MSDWRLIEGDCLDPVTGLGSLADGSVDHVICDPPYSEHVHGNARSNKRKPADAGRRYECDPKGHEISFDHLGDGTRIGAAFHLARIVRRWVLVFCEIEGAHLWIDALQTAGLEHIRVGEWERLGTMPQITGDRPATAFEAIEIAHPPGMKRWNGGGLPARWKALVAGKNGSRFHPTEKPLALMEALIRDFTDPGDLICDPFAGSGTTGVAAIHLGRRFIGWERDPKYAEAARVRLASTREQGRLFDEVPA